MAKKKGKNLQKLLKKRQLNQLQSSTEAITFVLAEQPHQQQIAPTTDLPKLPSGEGRPILKTLISTAIIVALLLGVSVTPASQGYLSKLGDWLYLELELGN